MHGRLKVKTPAEQQEAKRLEREKKIGKYRQGMKQLLALRGRDDLESITAIMKLTGALLTANSDLYTVRAHVNYRNIWKLQRHGPQKLESRVTGCDNLHFFYSSLYLFLFHPLAVELPQRSFQEDGGNEGRRRNSISLLFRAGLHRCHLGEFISRIMSSVGESLTLL